MTWRVVRHPLVGFDIFRMARHVAEQSGSEDAAEHRVMEAEETIAAIADNPMSGTKLTGQLAGFRRRQSRRDQRITVIFRSEPKQRLVYIHLVAFGGRNWQEDAIDR